MSDEEDAAKKAAEEAKAAEKAAKEAEKERKAAERAAAKEAKEAEKAQKAAEREAKRQEKEAAKAAKEAEKAQRVRQNGVLQPLPGSKCGQAWAIFDEISAKNKQPAKLAEALELAEPRGLNLGNVRAEYSGWRKFHGLPPQGRVKKEKPAEASPAAGEGGEAA